MMPFWGDLGLFETALRSVAAQSGDWRLVVIDDRYPGDRQRELVEAVGDPRVQYVLNAQNLGINGNFRRSIELAEAEHVVVIGCDDVMLPGYVERLSELVSRFDPDIVQPGVEVIDEYGRVIAPVGDRIKRSIRPKGPYPRLLEGEELAASLLRGNWTYFPSLLWRTETVRRYGFDERFEIALDLALLLRITEEGGTLLADDRPVFQYRRHASASSWSGSGMRRFEEEKTIFAEARATSRARGWRTAARAASLHWSSRVNAAMHVPGRLMRGAGRDAARLTAHALGPAAAQRTP